MTTAAHNGTRTSREAAQQILPFADNQRRRILEYLRLHFISGATREEIQDALGMQGDSVRPRVRELLKDHLISESDRTARTKSGRFAQVLFPVRP